MEDPALMAATGWQPHSVRGFLSAQLRKKKASSREVLKTRRRAGISNPRNQSSIDIRSVRWPDAHRHTISIEDLLFRAADRDRGCRTFKICRSVISGWSR